jgi:site-specific DNA recombinase
MTLPTSGVVDPTEREGLRRALELLRAGDASALVVPKLDRLARSLVGFCDVLKLAQTEGWDLIVLDPMLDLGTAIGRAMAGVLIGFGDVEREAFRDRMQGGRKAKAARGGYVGGKRLHERFGWRLVKQEDGGMEYEPEPEQQRVIGRIQELRAAGQKLADVAATLEAEGIPTPGGGQRWRIPTISQLARTALAV